MSSRAYQSLLRLYPVPFRLDYGDDLVQVFDDLVAEKGTAAAWRRTIADLCVTVPRYQLERVMNQQTSTQALNWAIIVLAAGGVISVMTGAYPGVVLILIAVVLGIAQRSKLAQAIRVPDRALRMRRLTTAAGLGVVFAGCYALYLTLIGDTWTTRETVLSLFGTLSMVASLGYLIAGLLTPRAPRSTANPTR